MNGSLDDAKPTGATLNRKQNRKRKFESVESSKSILSEAPKEINAVEFAESRAREIEAMTKDVMMLSSRRTIFQSVPKHMRRRATSHTLKRLPRRLREAAAAVDNRTKAGKCPSRFHRRRPKNLREDYARRQRKHVWLETHLWHAKRFKMVERWGYRLPLHPNDKSIRAAYRATDKHALLQDLSYLCCVELRGCVADITDSLSQLVSPSTGLTFAAKALRNGDRHGHVVLYKAKQYPCGAIGEVNFLWRSTERSHDEQDSKNNQTNMETDQSETQEGDAADLSSQNSEGQLWIWVHPACYEEVLEELKIVFEFSEFKDSKTCITEELERVSPGIEQRKSDCGGGDAICKSEKSASSSDAPIGDVIKSSKGGETKTIEDENKESISNEADVKEKSLRPLILSNGKVKLTSLKDDLLRFRLTGPLSQAVLSGVMKGANVKSANDAPSTWWEKWYKAPGMLDVHTTQEDTLQLLESVQSPGEVSPNAVLGLTVRDPRIFLPQKKTKAKPNPEVDSSSTLPPGGAFPPQSSQSALWDAEVRALVKQTKMTDQDMNRRRSSLLVPGSQLELGDEESRIPVLLLQHPGHHPSTPTSGHSTLGYASGWDIILPSGWGMSFWVALVYQGARVGGLRELESCSLEQGVGCYPRDYPDTQAGKLLAEEESDKLAVKYTRYPPAKRPNYVKLGVASPFHCPWETLVEEWRLLKSTPESKSDQEMFVVRDKKVLQCLSSFCRHYFGKNKHKAQSSPKPDLGALDGYVSEYSSGLVSVRVDMFGRGTPEDFDVICLPSTEDLETLTRDNQYGGPAEPQHKDTEKILKPKKVSKEKRKLAEKTLVESLNAPKGVVDSCCRKVIGYVSRGQYSYKVGAGTGLGFCTVPGFVRLVKESSSQLGLIALIRSTSSLQYRFICLSVVL